MVGLINAKENFKSLPDNVTALRTFGGGNFLSGIEFDEIDIDYSVATKEIYKYLLSGVIQAEIQLTYSSPAKNMLINIKKM